MKHEGPHSGSSPYTDPETGEVCFGCKIRTLRFDGSAVSVGRQSRGTRPARVPDPAWERGVAGERRPGGGFMPYLNSNLTEIGVKEYGERRHELDAKRKAQLTNPTSTP
jgi:hypothetical protein